MNKKILDILEFDKVKQLFEPYLQTEQGEMELAALTPTDKKESIETAFMELEDMEQILLEEPRFAVSTIQDVRPVAKRLEMEASLNIDELLALKAVLRVTHELKDFYDNLENVRLERLNRLFDNLVDLPRLQGGLQAINEGGFVESFASEKLAKIRRRIQENEHQVREILQDLLKSKADMLADAVIASRNGRNVLPVKNTYRNRIAGVVHDISASGNTVYIEPRAVVNLNEEIANHRADERYEIIQILEELSDTLRPHAAEIANNAWIIGHLDLIKAKYRFMRDCKAVVPEVSSNRSIQLLQLRHPLIENAVANDLHFTEDLTEIVITGPNTGGKTIMLKTLGLAQIMAQSGLPILADPGSRVGIFSQVFADIGDEQSIEQSLSTFSSHMTNIVSILHQVDTASLILLDELGAGTDPQEGAGLAIAILEDLRLRGIKTMATTHYPELKAYGIETAGVQNASMEFDTASLRPTYRFMQGVPGRSNAFEIARRLGLSETIIQDAMKMTNTDNDVNQIIEKLEAQTLESRKRLDTIQEVEQENLKFNRALRKLYNELTRERETELNKAREEAKEIVDMALSESDRILQGLHAKSQLKPHEIIEAKAQLKKLAPEIVDLSKNKVLKKAKKARAPKVGDEILVISYGQRGTLVKQLKDGRWEAQVGLIKMTLEEKEFNLIKAEKEATQPKKRQVNVVKRSNTSGPRARLDLRGKRYEEAMQELDGFIDQALLNNMAQVDIIHGIGTGVIREGVTKYLRRATNVVKELTEAEARNLNSFESLIDHNILSAREYQSGDYERNGYYTIKLFAPIYSALSSEKGTPGDLMGRRIAYELLAAKGFKDGMVPYISNQYEEIAKQKGKTINLYGKERGLVTDELVLDKVFEGKYASWAAFKKAMYKERVDQFENLKQVTFKDPTKPWPSYATKTINRVSELQALMDQAVLQDAVSPRWSNYNPEIDSAVHKLKRAIFKAYLDQTKDFRTSIFKK